MDNTINRVIYQFDLTGRYIGEALADISPREPGVLLMPGRTTTKAPPPRETWPDGTWPRWTGTDWVVTDLNKSMTPADDPLAKLQKFLEANPDVIAAIGIGTGV